MKNSVDIIAHRGLWLKESEQNSIESLTQAIKSGYGVETDIRDLDGKIVISHDLPNKKNILLSSFLEIYQSLNSFNGFKPSIAINIKSDGLHEKLVDLIDRFDVNNYFVFDMSIPDTLKYINLKLNTFIRISEYEIYPRKLKGIKGVWIDQFKKQWFTIDEISKHLIEGRDVCIVSSELHGRDEHELWKNIKHSSFDGRIMICTDKPRKAEQYFNG